VREGRHRIGGREVSDLKMKGGGAEKGKGVGGGGRGERGLVGGGGPRGRWRVLRGGKSFYGCRSKLQGCDLEERRETKKRRHTTSSILSNHEINRCENILRIGKRGAKNTCLYNKVKNGKQGAGRN